MKNNTLLQVKQIFPASRLYRRARISSGNQGKNRQMSSSRGSGDEKKNPPSRGSGDEIYQNVIARARVIAAEIKGIPKNTQSIKQDELYRQLRSEGEAKSTPEIDATISDFCAKKLRVLQDGIDLNGENAVKALKKVLGEDAFKRAILLINRNYLAYGIDRPVCLCNSRKALESNCHHVLGQFYHLLKLPADNVVKPQKNKDGAIRQKNGKPIYEVQTNLHITGCSIRNVFGESTDETFSVHISIEEMSQSFLNGSYVLLTEGMNSGILMAQFTAVGGDKVLPIDRNPEPHVKYNVTKFHVISGFASCNFLSNPVRDLLMKIGKCRSSDHSVEMFTSQTSLGIVALFKILFPNGDFGSFPNIQQYLRMLDGPNPELSCLTQDLERLRFQHEDAKRNLGVAQTACVSATSKKMKLKLNSKLSSAKINAIRAANLFNQAEAQFNNYAADDARQSDARAVLAREKAAAAAAASEAARQSAAHQAAARKASRQKEAARQITARKAAAAVEAARQAAVVEAAHQAPARGTARQASVRRAARQAAIEAEYWAGQAAHWDMEANTAVWSADLRNASECVNAAHNAYLNASAAANRAPSSYASDQVAKAYASWIEVNSYVEYARNPVVSPEDYWRQHR